MRIQINKVSLLMVFSVVFILVGCKTNPNLAMQDSSLPTATDCVKGPIEGTCIETDMVPTCYRMPLNQHEQICGPVPGGEFKSCDFGYGCYAMAKSRVCCSYCPIEWSGNCLGLQAEDAE